MRKHYDVVIIGAGMSGLAAGIRLAYYDKKVLICEQHGVLGGLNSYYQRAGRLLSCSSESFRDPFSGFKTYLFK